MVKDLLKRFLGDYTGHNESNGQISFNCPACAEDKCLPHGKSDGKYKLAINYHKGIYRCWVCAYENNMHGKIPNLIKKYGNKSILKEYLLLKPEEGQRQGSEELVATKVELPKGFKLLSESKPTDYRCGEIFQYLWDRGITNEMIAYYKIGYTLVGKYYNRIIIPSFDEFGDLNYFVGRAWNKWHKPKYLNPDAEKELIIFNEDKINLDGTIYLVEGAFDHIVIPNSIPILGKELAKKLKQTLYHKAKADIIILLDDDAYDTAVDIYKDLNSGNLYNRIKLCRPPAGYDPSLVFEREGNEGIIKLLKSSKKPLESEIY